jgi:hypothetical protein
MIKSAGSFAVGAFSFWGEPLQMKVELTKMKVGLWCQRLNRQGRSCRNPRITAGSPSNSLTEIPQYSKETRYGTAEEAAEKAPVRCMSEGPRGLSSPE